MLIVLRDLMQHSILSREGLETRFEFLFRGPRVHLTFPYRVIGLVCFSGQSWVTHDRLIAIYLMSTDILNLNIY